MYLYAKMPWKKMKTCYLNTVNKIHVTVISSIITKQVLLKIAVKCIIFYVKLKTISITLWETSSDLGKSNMCERDRMFKHLVHTKLEKLRAVKQ